MNRDELEQIKFSLFKKLIETAIGRLTGIPFSFYFEQSVENYRKEVIDRQKFTVSVFGKYVKNV